MKKLGDQWIEIIDGQEHMVKAVDVVDGCQGCFFHGTIMHESDCKSETINGCHGGRDFIIKDLGILKDGRLPCPFCGEYPESFNKGNEYTKKRGSVLKCNKCHYELTVCAIYQTIEWCKEKVLYDWNRRE